MTEMKNLENIVIEGSENSPAVDMNFEENVFKISGMSYMEDVASFYDRPLKALNEHLSSEDNSKVKFIFDLSYFNSSSSRVVFGLFEMLDEAANVGNEVSIDWYFDDEDIAEEGEMLAEDLEKATFNLIEKE